MNYFPSTDRDWDRLSDTLEIQLGTDPDDSDSDNDNLLDGFEYAHGLAVQLGGDASGDEEPDGLTNIDEQSFGTDPRVSDSDGDGLTDNDEVNVHGSDPTLVDTDDDGLTDYEEVVEHGSDPTLKDSDGDGLTDYAEVRIHATLPMEPDSDFDGMTDGFEVTYWLTQVSADADTDNDGLTNAEESDAKTDPRSEDTDGDLVLDSWEVNLYHTDPKRSDSDGSGRSDAQELFSDGTDPNDPADDLPIVVMDRTLNEESGAYWKIDDSNGRIIETDSYATGFGADLKLDGAAYVNRDSDDAYEFGVSLSGRELHLSPQAVGDLRISRRIFVPDRDASFIRYLEIVNNPTDTEQYLKLSLESRYATSNINVLTSDGDELLEPLDDDLLVMADANSSSRKVLGHVFHGPNAKLRPSKESAMESYVWTIEYQVTVPAHGRRIIMHMAALDETLLSGFGHAANLRRAEGATLDNLTPQDRQDIVNMFAYPDADQDGLSDETENTIGTDPGLYDTDGDGLSDLYEQTYSGLDPLSPPDSGDESSDLDSDNLTALQEQELGTDPTLTDTDNDQLDDDAELQQGTDPLDPDSDDDGLLDGEEINVHSTDPLLIDSDGDGMNDGFEVLYGLTGASANGDADIDLLSNIAEQNYGTNPNLADTDGDGLSDFEEIFYHATDPNKSDSDGDGLSDGDEVNQYGTYPDQIDSDADGLSDYVELIEVNTDPLKRDTDGDGAWDGLELESGTDPRDDTSVPADLAGMV
jgi:hypothetical protein